MKALTWLVILLVVLGGGYWYMQGGNAGRMMGDFGTYAYLCEGGTEFSMTPASDLATITVAPGQGASFSEITLAKTESTAAARYEAGDVVFIGAGEEVMLTVDGITLVCNPVPSDSEAPFNWGDTGEGAGMMQDATLAVSENIVGTWKSIDDAKFTREFKADGSAIDSYDGKADAPGMWKTFGDKNPLEVAFPIEVGEVYLQMTGETEADTLNFKVMKVTPEELELIYMDRGGILRFTRVQ